MLKANVITVIIKSVVTNLPLNVLIQIDLHIAEIDAWHVTSNGRTIVSMKKRRMAKRIDQILHLCLS